MRTVLTTAQRNARSLSFGSEEAARPHSLTREVDDLRNDIEDAFVALESGANLPIIGNLGGSIVNGAAGGTSSLAINGSNLLASRVQASAIIADITFSAVLPGTAGNDIDIVIVVGNANDNLSVSDTNNTVTITLGADANGDPDDAKNAAGLVVAAVNSGSALINASEDGADPVSAAVASTSLSGGTGRGLVATAFHGSDSESLTISSVSNSSITFADSQLQGLTAGDMVGIVLSSHTAQSNVAHIIVA